MARVFSGFKPTGHLTLGNLIGALRSSVELQHRAECVYAVVDLHALTVEHDPAQIRELSKEAAALLLAAGLDPTACTVFVQSHVAAHAELSYLLECTAHVGEMRRMIQYKEKSRSQQEIRLSLLTYPALMAADILAYGAEEVPIGDDQRQHVELARDLAIRFNRTYGETFVVPRATYPPVAARVMDLQEPTEKMGKSNASGVGVIYLLDPPDTVRRKVMRAVTDSGADVRYDPAAKPGVSNLLAILAACTGSALEKLRYGSYASLKRDVADAVVEELRPIQRRYGEFSADPAALEAVLRAGAQRAAGLAAPTVARAKRLIGLLPAASKWLDPEHA